MTSAKEVLLPETVLRNYLRAKDENRPHVLDETFEHDAVLEIQNNTAAITFPAVTQGRIGIAHVLVSDFGRTYENVYTFYLQRPFGSMVHFSCGWLVAMTEKSNDAVRVGFGQYYWTFSERPPHLARKLIITIETMAVLPNTTMREVFNWISRLTYPWTSPEDALLAAPALAELQPILAQLGAG